MRFMMLGPARSGTTAIRTALDRHPNVTCHGEILGPNRVLGVARGTGLGSAQSDELLCLRNSNTRDFIDRALTAAAPVSGFKAIYYQLLQPGMAELLCHLRSDKRLVIVFTWRRNLAERFLSEKKLRLRHLRKDAPEQEFEIKVNLEEMFQDCRNQMAVRALMRELFAGHPCADFEYEDVLKRSDLQELNTVLALPPPAITLPTQKFDYRGGIKVTIENESEALAAYESRSAEFDMES
jgi:hypothetical protein